MTLYIHCKVREVTKIADMFERRWLGTSEAVPSPIRSILQEAQHLLYVRRLIENMSIDVTY